MLLTITITSTIKNTIATIIIIATTNIRIITAKTTTKINSTATTITRTAAAKPITMIIVMHNNE